MPTTSPKSIHFQIELLGSDLNSLVPALSTISSKMRQVFLFLEAECVQARCSKTLSSIKSAKARMEMSEIASWLDGKEIR